MPPVYRRLALVALIFLSACGDQKLGPDAGLGPCSDGIDNDGDGAIDFPSDPGCESEADDTEDSSPLPACSDHRDNDGDGKVDFPEDPGCVEANADDETDDCPDGPGCPQCSDGKDNDMNGMSDWPTDASGCRSAGDFLEFIDDPVACGPGLQVKALPLGGSETSMLMPTSTSSLTTPCGGGGGVPAVAYVFHLSQPQVIVATTDDPITTIDTVLDLRTADCDDPAAHVACDDNADESTTIVRSLGAGTYYLIVEGKTTADMGPYGISVQFFAGDGQTCSTADDCGPGLVCRIPLGETTMQCALPVCSDGVDEDGDSKIDYPNDPGCTSPDDDDEVDSCPTGADCPLCGNEQDDDGDGLTDFPADTNCISAAHNFESCQQSEPVVIATGPVVSGTTAGKVDDFRPTPGSINGHLCSTSSTTASAPDVAIQLDIPALLTLDLDLTFPGTSFDSSHTLLDASCGGTPIDCRDAATMPLTNIAAGTYYVVVDGYSTGSGQFDLNISGTIAPGESCESPLAQSGALVCGPATMCGGTPGSRTCIPTQCNDGMDNNGDGVMDYPADPGCSSTSDEVEDTVCPGPSCPACADGADNEMDGVSDYPGDPSCLFASQPFEYCPQSEAAIVATGPQTNGTTAGMTNDYRPTPGSINGHTCSTTSTTTATAPDVAIELEVPALSDLNLDLTFPGTSFDSSHTLLDASCGGTPVDCRDATAMPLMNVAAGKYYLIVDGYSSGSGAFTLNVSGTIENGEPCDDVPLSASGALTCSEGYACKGTAGSKTCQPAECSDTIDNNGDGLTDYPADPSCVDISDDTETTVCPGPDCPVCYDGLDNDVDGTTDYPNDPSYISASGTSEGCMQTEPITLVTMPQTPGTTSGATNDFTPPPGSVNGHLCSTSGTHTAPDVAYQLVLPATTSLDIKLTFPNGSFDSSHSLLGATCGGAPIDCRDNPDMPLTDVAAGTYYVVVDGYSSASGDFTLNVSGTIANGESCESALAQSGALTCEDGYACQGTPGSRTCQVAQCGDGMDNNGDGTIDFPDDPGCETASDNEETTVCPGPMCPVCANGVDDDGDGWLDYPDDPSCLSASWDNESCNVSEPIAVITSAVTSGTTTGAFNDSVPYCGSSTHNAPDVLLQLDVPDLDTLDLNVAGFDTAHSLLDATCGDAPIFCSDPASKTTEHVRAGRYYVAIDGWGTGSGDWTLTTSGTVAPGGSCEGALFQAGVFTCATGLTCTGPVGSRTCQSQCSDGIDNNGDGLVDFPEDPGCEDGYDNVEDLLCPGPMCPVCSNMMDDDLDLAIDWPQDNACSAASTSSELFCPIDPDFGGTITVPMTFGTLAGRADNYDQSCSTSTANDVVYALNLPVPVMSLQLDTLGSVAYDTVISVKDAQCEIEYGCDDDGAFQSDNRALLKLPGLPAGHYAVQVDAASTSSNNPFFLNVRGTVAEGNACTDVLFTNGVLRCEPGTACIAGTCQ